MSKIIYSPARLILITGIPGSGKTTLSTGIYNKSGKQLQPGLLNAIQATYINKDAINDAFSREKRSGKTYDLLRSGVYKAMDNLARQNLLFGNTVIIEATYQSEIQKPSWLKRYKKIAKELRIKLKPIRCIAPENIIKQRLTERNLKRDQHKISPAGWKKFLKKEPINVPWPKDGLIIDTSQNFQNNLKTVLDFLKK